MWNPESFSGRNQSNMTGARDWTEVYEVVWWIQLVMGVLSVLGSGSIIVCLISQRLSRKPELQPLFLLSVADLLLAACWLVGAVFFSLRCGVLNSLCYNLHILEQIFFMASFCFTLTYVWNLYQAIREKFNSCLSGHSVQVSNRMSTGAKTAAILSWLGPVLFMLPVFVIGNMNVCQTNSSQPYKCLLMQTDALYRTSHGHQLSASCSLLHTYRMVVFLVTFLLTLSSIIVLVAKARHFHVRAMASNGIVGPEQRAALRVLDQRVVLYPLVFVLCWGSGESVQPSPRERQRRSLSCCLLLSGGAGLPACGQALHGSRQGGGWPLHHSGESVAETPTCGGGGSHTELRSIPPPPCRPSPPPLRVSSTVWSTAGRQCTCGGWV
ncbi:Transmembrane protein 116 [Oryzias melastigma]|uniref:Transmembrane protein 116 n=1 Tax=Oryzias melastigma TaxID=30732 RepID=A0A834L100_ORYME|nr:Transmembrane protein 116 [Oryzias melastigma]